MNWKRGIRLSEYRVRILPFAEDDMENLIGYIASELKAPETAANTARGFKKAIHDLSVYPQSHELDEDKELARYGIRKIYYKKYKIYFTIDECRKVVYILRVFHMLVNSREKVINFLEKDF